MSPTVVGFVSLVVFLVGGGLAYLYRARVAARSKAAAKAAEAVEIKRQLDISREHLLKGEDVRATEVARLEAKLSNRKRELATIRAERYRKNDSTIAELLDELGL